MVVTDPDMQRKEIPMSIEKILLDLTKALTAQTEAMEKMIASSGGKPASGGKAAASGKAATGKAAATKTGPTVEDVAATVTAYLKSGTASAKATAKENVGRIIEHFGADRFTTIPEASRAESLDMLNDFMEGRTPEALAGDGDGDGDEDEDESMV